MNKKIVFVIAVFLLGGIGIVYWWNVTGLNHGPDGLKGDSKPVLYPSLNGTMVEKEIAESRPLGVMIENHSDARPQSGLDKADLVYETVAEGGITRFLAIFHSTPASQIGPVRSARDYYAELANEWGVLYAHVGGSDEVLEQLKQKQYKNIDDISEIFAGKYFRRVKSRSAPHNTYTSTGELQKFLNDWEYDDKASFEPWQFKQDAPAPSQTPATTVRLNFSLPSYAVRYEYDTVAKKYRRFIAGKPQLDAETDQQLTASNIIVQYVKITDVPGDPKLRVDINLIDTGKGLLFSQGTVSEISWSKPKNGKTKFFDNANNEITFLSGQTWIELIPTNSVTYQ